MPRDPDHLLVLAGFRNRFEADQAADALEDEGITAKQLRTETASVFAVDAAAISQVQLLVRRADMARAREILRDFKPRRADVNWSEVETGDPEPPVPIMLVCPSCGYERTGVDEKNPCPECGGADAPYERRRPKPDRKKARRQRFLAATSITILVVVLLVFLRWGLGP